MNITDAEWRVMRVIWESQPASAAEVIAAVVPETGWSHRTVRTLLARLVEKGALAAEADGNRYLYRAQVSRSRCIRRESRSFLQKVFGGDAAEMLVHFVRNTRISPEQIAQIKRLLEEKQRDERG
jgi:BlaI family penicillinase repressor